jgi:tetratricopeptide (TPR) repeat protein
MSGTSKKSAKAMIAVAIIALLLAPGAQAKARKTVAKRHAVSAGQTSALVSAGLESLERKEYSAAIASFSKAARAKGDGGTYFLLGYAYYQRGFMAGDPDRADKQDAVETVNAYSTALALDPTLSQVTQPYKLYHSMAMSYESLGSYEKAVDAYKKAFQAAPHNPMLPLYAARLRYRMNDMKKSAANLDLALSMAKKEGKAKALVNLVETDPKFSMMLANDAHLAALRKYDPSASASAAPASAPTASPAAFAQTAGYGIAFAAPNPAPTVAASAQTAVALRDTNPAGIRDSVRGTAPSDDRAGALRAQDKDVLDALAAANDEFKFRNYRPAINGYNDALALNVGSGILNPTQAAFINERIGTAYNKLGQSAEAIHALRQCVQMAPMDSAAHYQLALAYAVLGRYQESIHAVGETLNSAPSTGELKKYMLLAKTDSELEGVRDLPAFKATLDEHRSRALAVR